MDSCRKLTVACRGKERGNIKTTVKTCLSFLGDGKVKMSIIVLWIFSVEMISGSDTGPVPGSDKNDNTLKNKIRTTMRKKDLWGLLTLMMAAVFCVAFASCSDDDDDDDWGGGSGDGTPYKVSLSYTKSNMKNNKWYYKATITVSGAKASQVTTLGVRWQKKGAAAGSVKEAGGATTKATCEFGGLDTKSTYYVNAYANISGTRVESDKKTLTIR